MMGDMLTRKEVVEIFEKAKERVHVTCDEMHGHCALDGCIGAKKAKDKDAVTICKLVEHIRRIDRLVRPVTVYAGEERVVESGEDDEEEDEDDGG